MKNIMSAIALSLIVLDGAAAQQVAAFGYAANVQVERRAADSPLKALVRACELAAAQARSSGNGKCDKSRPGETYRQERLMPTEASFQESSNSASCRVKSYGTCESEADYSIK